MTSPSEKLADLVTTIDATLATLTTSVAALGPAVQGLVNAGIVTAQARSGHTGNDAAVNVVYANGQTAEQYKAIVDAFMSGIPTASIPNVTVDPTIAGATTVDSVLTATPGAVTNGTSGGHTDRYQWNRVLGGASTTIPGATAITYRSVAGDRTYQLSVSHTPVDSAAPFLQGNTRTSLLTAVITGTIPANTVAPAISPSGTQAANTVLTCSSGTWTNGSTYTYLFYDNGVAIGTRSSVATLTLTSAMAGHSITADVISTSTLGVSSAAVAASNTVTVSGTNVVAMTIVPTLTRANGEAAGVVYSGYSYPIVGATLTVNGTVTVASSRQWDFYVNGTYWVNGEAR